MVSSGLHILSAEDDWFDRELNFKGAAAPEIARNWEARLERMVTLKAHFGERYEGFCREFMETITQENHVSRAAVRYYIGVKKATDRGLDPGE